MEVPLLHMPRLLCFVPVILLAVLDSACSQIQSNRDAATHAFYVAADGNDANSGRSPDAPWKTIARVNQATFQPGDAILLRSGDVWNGQLHPLGSGMPGRPIRLDQYGRGAKPVINLGTATGAAVKLTNQQWWEIGDLEITSGIPPQAGIGRQGIVVAAEGAGGHTGHVIVRDCFIHDIWGQLGGTGTSTGYNSAAIFVGPAQGGGGGRGGATANALCAADDITVENNRIERVDRCGIIVWHGYDHILVRGNTMENLGGDAIFMNGPRAGIMERNIARRTCMRTGDTDVAITGNYNPHSAAMWIQNCTDTLMQFNECYDTGRQKGNGDGTAYDFDFTCRNCIAQYNYSRNNHGFLLIMERTQGNIARYNISENDQGHLVQMHGTLAENNSVYNNIFYVDYGTIDIDFYMGNTEISDDAKRQLGAHFENNIFYATGQGRFRTVYTYDNALNRKFVEKRVSPPAPGAIMRHNCYFGPWLNGLPDDPEALQADPLFLAPGSGGVGLNTLTGYQLHDRSPCIGAGLLIPNPGARDFFGNPLRLGKPSIGVFEPPASMHR